MIMIQFIIKIKESMKERIGILSKTGEEIKISLKGKRRKFITCKCDCGNNHSVDLCHWNNEKVKSCGCNRYKSLIHKRFGRLTVIQESSRRRDKSTGEKYWMCKCNCGSICEIATTDLTKNTGTRSCGCLIKKNIENIALRRLKRIFSCFKKNAKRRNLEFILMENEVLNLINSPCFYCNRKKSNKMKLPKINDQEDIYIEYMGIDRKDSSKFYTSENTVPCCKSCNTIKNRKTFDEYLKQIKII